MGSEKYFRVPSRGYAKKRTVLITSQTPRVRQAKVRKIEYMCYLSDDRTIVVIQCTCKVALRMAGR